MSEHEASLFLNDPHQVEIAYIATMISGKAPNARPFLEMVVGLMPSDELQVQMHGAEAYVLKREIVDSLDSLRNRVGGYSHLVIAAEGLLGTLRDNKNP